MLSLTNKIKKKQTTKKKTKINKQKPKQMIQHPFHINVVGCYHLHLEYCNYDLHEYF